MDATTKANALAKPKVEQRQRLLDRNEALLAMARVGERELTEAETDEFSAVADLIDKLNTELSEPVPRQTDAMVPPGARRGPRGLGLDDTEPPKSGGWVDQHTRQPIKVYGLGDKMAPDVSEDPCFLGRMLVGVARGDIGSELSQPEIAALSGSTDTAGGFTLPPEMFLPVLDAVRSQSVAFRAGVQTLPMTSREARIAFVENDPVIDWAPERTTGTDDTTMTFGAVDLHARTCRVQVPISEELLADASNGAQAAQTAMINAIALGLDKAILFGQQSGDAEEPQGLRHVAGTTERASVGTPTGYSDYALAYADCLIADAREPLQLIQHPRDWGIMDRLLDGNGVTLAGPESWQRLQKFVTTSIPVNEGAGSNESFGLMGPFREIIVGIRLNPQIIVGARAASDLKKYQRTILAVLRADVGVPRPGLFTKLTGITIR